MRTIKAVKQYIQSLEPEFVFGVDPEPLTARDEKSLRMARNVLLMLEKGIAEESLKSEYLKLRVVRRKRDGQYEDWLKQTYNPSKHGQDPKSAYKTAQGLPEMDKKIKLLDVMLQDDSQQIIG